nr:HDOD domain-containing protein [Salinicola tamaricis]
MPYQALFEHVHRLPSIPGVVAELIASLDDDRASIQQVSVIYARIRGSVSSCCVRPIRYATVSGATSPRSTMRSCAGFERVRTLVIASGMVGVIEHVPGLDRRAFWKTSFTVANLARAIVRHSRVGGLSPETAFTCGILHHVGSALMHIAHPEVMARIDALVAQGAPRSELESSQFGYTFSEVGAELGRRWRFPETICRALTYQSAPLEAEPFSPYAAAVHLAIGIDRDVANGQREEHALGEMPRDVRRPLALDLLALYEESVSSLRGDDELDVFLGKA